ncbi:MAG: HNH endonuclease [Anaerolineae bacterium]|jgi:hypothetical protein|nr:HNH endonuclease [Anaerolineae bacterium]
MPNDAALPLTDIFSRFMGHVHIPWIGECWLWAGAKMKDGYGNFKANGKYVRAHRFAYEHFNGPIQPGMEVCHSCDNPLCVNPKHLFQATHTDNMRDCISKSRHRHGERHSGAKLNADSVRTIRSWYADSINGERPTLKYVADIFGVCQQTVLNVINRKVWAHVA